jgi:Rrf2 family nitric oxide-sensitive transcriptional repressor
MRLTQFTDYGLRVLTYLASRDGEHVTTEDLSTLFNVSWDHLLKVVRRLCELGYVEAKRGPSGGVRFVPATREVTVGEVVRNLESQLEIVECFDERTNTCPVTSICRLAPVLRRASGAFLRELDQVRIGDLVPRPSELRSVLRSPPRARADRRPH